MCSRIMNVHLSYKIMFNTKLFIKFNCLFNNIMWKLCITFDLYYLFDILVSREFLNFSFKATSIQKKIVVRQLYEMNLNKSIWVRNQFIFLLEETYLIFSEIMALSSTITFPRWPNIDIMKASVLCCGSRWRLICVCK